MKQITFDFSKTTHPPKMIHGVNNGPICNQNVVNLSRRYREMHIPSVRLHDTDGANSRFYVDVSRIFPNFDADEKDPANYYFLHTDHLIESIDALGAEVVYRLGESIDHDIEGRYARPPKDFDKWCRIAVNIIRHYNDGWADGHHYGIRCWEIWNEGEGINEHGIRCNWRGGNLTQLFDLYRRASRAIRDYDPTLTVGGMAFCSTGDAMEQFVRFCREEDLPLDFLSYHGYESTYDAVYQNAVWVRELLDRFGFTDTRIWFDEWNYIGFERPWEGDIWMMIRNDETPELCREVHENQKNEVGGSFAAAALIALNDGPCDKAHYYDGQIASNWCGLFDAYSVPQKPFYTFCAYGQMYSACTQMIAVDNSTMQPPYAMAGVGEGVRMILLSNYRGESGHIALDMHGLGQGIKKAEIFRISKTQNLALDRVEYYTAEDVTQIVSAEPYDVLFIRLTNVTSL